MKEGEIRWTVEQLVQIFKEACKEGMQNEPRIGDWNWPSILEDLNHHFPEREVKPG